jgi:hypothetical protein
MADLRVSWSHETVTMILALVLYWLPVNTATRCLILFVAFCLGGHLIWTATSWHAFNKISAMSYLFVVYLMVIRPLIFPVPTFVYLLPGRGLGENTRDAPREMVARRVFYLEQQGPEILRHVTINLHDNNPATDQTAEDHTEQYLEMVLQKVALRG